MALLVPLAALAAAGGGGGGGTAATGTSGGGTPSTTSATTTATSSGQGGSGGGGASTSSGQGGSGGSTSSTSSASSTASASSSASSGVGGGAACTWAVVDPCGPGLYCDAPGCQQGTCVPKGTVEIATRDPVCGCDNVTYWNSSVADGHGVSVAKSGVCAIGKTCGGFGNLKCPAGATCNYSLNDKTMCNIADNSGNCWAIPTMCPVVVTSNTRACGAPTCTDECGLIKLGAPHYADSTCP